MNPPLDTNMDILLSACPYIFLYIYIYLWRIRIAPAINNYIKYKVILSSHTASASSRSPIIWCSAAWVAYSGLLSDPWATLLAACTICDLSFELTIHSVSLSTVGLSSFALTATSLSAPIPIISYNQNGFDLF